MSARAHCNTEYRGFLELAQRLLVRFNGTLKKVTGQQPFYRVCVTRPAREMIKSEVELTTICCVAVRWHV